jgi:predicted RNase H-like HicB family nuclease
MTHTLHNRALATWKLCVSFLKREWNLSDYPVVVKEQSKEPTKQGARLKQQRYMAFVVNWAGLAGTGDTEQEALRNLEGTFVSAKAERQRTHEPLPRPGTTVPVQFASSERVVAHPELTADFIRRVLELDWAWISDESSLWDFHESETNDALVAKIREVYGVDVSDISSAQLWEIFDRIEPHKSVS